MRLSLGQYATRLTCGLELLLLSAIQQKVCTWPVQQESESRQPAETMPAPTPREQRKQKTKRPPTLAAMLPDVAPPRWPNHACLTAVQRGRPLPSTTWVNGPPGSDDESANPIGPASMFGSAWSRQPAAQRPPTLGGAGRQLVCLARHVFESSILKTGPPPAQMTRWFTPPAQRT